MNRNFMRGSKKSKMKKIRSGAEETQSKIAVEVISVKTLYYIVSTTVLMYVVHYVVQSLAAFRHQLITVLLRMRMLIPEQRHCQHVTVLMFVRWPCNYVCV